MASQQDPTRRRPPLLTEDERRKRRPPLLQPSDSEGPGQGRSLMDRARGLAVSVGRPWLAGAKGLADTNQRFRQEEERVMAEHEGRTPTVQPMTGPQRLLQRQLVETEDWLDENASMGERLTGELVGIGSQYVLGGNAMGAGKLAGKATKAIPALDRFSKTLAGRALAPLGRASADAAAVAPIDIISTLRGPEESSAQGLSMLLDTEKGEQAQEWMGTQGVKPMLVRATVRALGADPENLQESLRAIAADPGRRAAFEAKVGFGADALIRSAWAGGKAGLRGADEALGAGVDLVRGDPVQRANAARAAALAERQGATVLPPIEDIDPLDLARMRAELNFNLPEQAVAEPAFEVKPTGRLRGRPTTRRTLEPGTVEGLDALTPPDAPYGRVEGLEAGIAEARLAQMGIEPPTTRALPPGARPMGPAGPGPKLLGGGGVPEANVFDPSRPPAVPEGRNITAIELDDGRIVFDPQAGPHVQVAQNLGIPLARMTEGGFITPDGRYVRSSAMAYPVGEQARAAERIEAKRAARLRGPAPEPPRMGGTETGAALPELTAALGRTAAGATVGGLVSPEDEKLSGMAKGAVAGLVGPAALRRVGDAVSGVGARLRGYEAGLESAARYGETVLPPLDVPPQSAYMADRIDSAYRGRKLRGGATLPEMALPAGRTVGGATVGGMVSPEGEKLEGMAGGAILANAPAALRRLKGTGKGGFAVDPRALPMDETSRLARAREQGFDVDTPQYTGFNYRAVGEGPSEVVRDTWFSDVPEIASEYTGKGDFRGDIDYRGAQVVPGYVRGNILDLTDNYAADGALRSVFDEVRESVPSDVPFMNDAEVFARAGDIGWDVDGVDAGTLRDQMLYSDFIDHVTGGTLWNAEGTGRRRFEATVLDAVKDLGYDGVSINDATFGRPNVSTVVFDPANVRSKFAKFDPANIGKSDLSGFAVPELGVVPRVAGGAVGGSILASQEGGLTPGEGALLGAGLMGAGPPAVKKLRGIAGRELRVRGDLPQVVFDWKRVKGASVSAQETQVRYAARDMHNAAKEAYGQAYAKLPEAEIDKINAVLGGRASPTTLPAAMRGPVQAMRDHIDVLSAEMIRSGAVDGPLAGKVGERMGTYLNRSYQVFDDPKWAEKVPDAVRNKAKAFIRAEYPNASQGEIDGILNEMLYRHAAADEGPIAALASGKLGSKSLGILQKRKDIPPEIRALWGEYNDPLVNYSRSVAKMSNLISSHKFLERVKADGMGHFLYDTPIVKDGVSYHERIAAEGSKTMAPLNGLYTSPEVARAFEEALDPEVVGPWMRHYMKVNSAVKVGKTVGSVVTQVRNLLSNPMIELANGNFRFWNVPKAVGAVATQVGSATESVVKRVSKIAGSQKDWRKYYMDLQRLGVVDESAQAGELRDMLLDAGMREGKIADAFADPRSSIFRKGAQIAGDVYRANDDLFKVYAFEGEYARYRKALPNMPEAELRKKVAGIVTDTRPTYSKVPKLTRRFRRFPLVGNFVSFPSEIVRGAYNTLRIAGEEMADPALRGIGAQRVAGMLAAASVVGGAATFSRFVTGITKDEDDDLRNFMPPWSKNANILHLGQGPDGDYRYIDLSYTDPYAYLRKPVVALMRGDDWQASLKDSAVELFSPFLSEEILASTLLNVRGNQRDGQGSGRIYNPEDSGDEQLMDIVAYVAQRVEPGTISSLKRIHGGLTGKVTRSGRSFDPKAEATAMFTGQRIGKINLTQGTFFRAMDLENRMRDANSVFTSAFGDLSGTADPGTAYLTATKRRAEIFKEAHDIAHAARRLGLSGKAVEGAFKEAGFSQENFKAIAQGRVPNYVPSKQYLDGLRAKMRSAGIANPNSEIERRRQLVRTANTGGR